MSVVSVDLLDRFQAGRCLLEGHFRLTSDRKPGVYAMAPVPSIRARRRPVAPRSRQSQRLKPRSCSLALGGLSSARRSDGPAPGDLCRASRWQLSCVGAFRRSRGTRPSSKMRDDRGRARPMSHERPGTVVGAAAIIDRSGRRWLDVPSLRRDGVAADVSARVLPLCRWAARSQARLAD
jgi:hypothetical protein